MIKEVSFKSNALNFARNASTHSSPILNFPSAKKEYIVPVIAGWGLTTTGSLAVFNRKNYSKLQVRLSSAATGLEKSGLRKKFLTKRLLPAALISSLLYFAGTGVGLSIGQNKGDIGLKNKKYKTDDSYIQYLNSKSLEMPIPRPTKNKYEVTKDFVDTALLFTPYGHKEYRKPALLGLGLVMPIATAILSKKKFGKLKDQLLKAATGNEKTNLKIGFTLGTLIPKAFITSLIYTIGATLGLATAIKCGNNSKDNKKLS